MFPQTLRHLLQVTSAQHRQPSMEVNLQLYSKLWPWSIHVTLLPLKQWLWSIHVTFLPLKSPVKSSFRNPARIGIIQRARAEYMRKQIIYSLLYEESARVLVIQRQHMRQPNPLVL